MVAPANKAVAPTAVKLGACGMSRLSIPTRIKPKTRLIVEIFFTIYLTVDLKILCKITLKSPYWKPLVYLSQN